MSDAELGGWLDTIATLRGVKKKSTETTVIRSLRRKRPPVKRAVRG